MSIMHQGQKYTVKLTTEPIGGKDGQRAFLGTTKEAENIIVIDGTMPKTRQEEVVLHEMIHLCDMSMPEWMVNATSRGLYGILRDNGLMPANIIGKVVDGTLTKAETEKINEASNQMAGQPMIPMGMAARVTSIKLAVTNKPWSGDASDYTIEQWKRACLIHLDDVEDPMLKSSHKLPVREPNGDINRNGCHAAAAVLGGARGGVDAPAEKKKAAAKALVRIYKNELDEMPPQSMMDMAGMS